MATRKANIPVTKVPKNADVMGVPQDVDVATLKNTAEPEQINIRYILAEAMSNILWSDLKIDWDKNDKELDEFFNALLKNNMLQIFKGGEKFLSQRGYGVLVWDVWEPHETESGVKEIDVTWTDWDVPAFVQRYEQKNDILFCEDWLTVTNGVSRWVKIWECRAKNETYVKTVTSNIIGNEIITPGGFRVKVGKTFNKFKRDTVRKHGYGVVPAMEIYNKNYFNYQSFSKEILYDDYPVEDLVKTINGILYYWKREINNNTTKWVSNGFTYQDMNKELNNFAKNLASKKMDLSKLDTRTRQAIELVLTEMQSSQNKGQIMDNDYINVSSGGGNLVIDKLQSTFNGKSIVEGFLSMVEVYFNGAGLDYSLGSETKSQYVSSAELQNNSGRTVETMKMKKQLREKQYKQLIKDMLIGWFKSKEKADSKDDLWNFECVTNIVTERFEDYQRVTDLFTNGLISRERAIKLTNPYMTDSEVERELERIEKERQQEEERIAKLGQESQNTNTEANNNE